MAPSSAHASTLGRTCGASLLSPFGTESQGHHTYLLYYLNFTWPNIDLATSGYWCTLDVYATCVCIESPDEDEGDMRHMSTPSLPRQEANSAHKHT